MQSVVDLNATNPSYSRRLAKLPLCMGILSSLPHQYLETSVTSLLLYIASYWFKSFSSIFFFLRRASFKQFYKSYVFLLPLQLPAFFFSPFIRYLLSNTSYFNWNRIPWWASPKRRWYLPPIILFTTVKFINAGHKFHLPAAFIKKLPYFWTTW